MNFRITLLVFLASTFLFSACVTPNFSIVPTEDKFSGANAPYGYIGKNNRISTKSTKGGTHIDEKGVYLNPYVFKDKTSKSVLSVGFHIEHYNFEIKDGFRPIQRVIFLTNSGNRIEGIVKSKDSDFDIGTWNNISKEYNTTFYESGVITIPLDKFISLANSKWIEVKIVGGKLIQTYNKNEITPAFLPNLKTFFQNKVLN